MQRPQQYTMKPVQQAQQQQYTVQPIPQAEQQQYTVQPIPQIQQPQYTMQSVQQVQQPQYTMQSVQQVQPVQQQVQQVQMRYSNQPPVMIVTQPPPEYLADKFKSSAHKQMAVLCSIQIAMGVLCVMFGIVLAAQRDGYYRSRSFPAFLGYGIWNGIFFVLVGGIGKRAVKTNTKGWIIGTMILNIICSALWCVFLTAFTSIGLIVNSSRGRICNGFSSNRCSKAQSIANTFYAMDSMMLIMAIIQFVITIWCAALCCGAVCRCCKGPVGGHVHNNAPVPIFSAYPVTHPGATFQQGYAVGVQQVQLGGMTAPPPSYTREDDGTQGYAMQNTFNNRAYELEQSQTGDQTQDRENMYVW